MGEFIVRNITIDKVPDRFNVILETLTHVVFDPEELAPSGPAPLGHVKPSKLPSTMKYLKEP